MTQIDKGKGDFETPSSAVVAQEGAIIQKRMIVWGTDGVPRPAAVPSLSTASISELAVVALSLPYKPDPLCPSDVEFEGMSNAEVMIVKLARSAAGGSQAATTELLDRVLGRPKQSIESKSLSMSYADVLKEKATRLAEAHAQKEGAIDVVIEAVRHVSVSPEDDADLGGLV